MNDPDRYLHTHSGFFGWLAAFFAGFVLGGLLLAQAPTEPAPLPYRFLLVINDQWKDPGSEVIDETSELSMLCALLKSWGLPFDVYRLDQQRFDPYHLLDRAGRPLHGTIIWNAPGARLAPDAVDLLRRLVQEQGVGLVAFSDTVATPVVAELAGVSRSGQYVSPDDLAFVGEHFVTRGVNSHEPPPVAYSKLLRNRWTAAAAHPGGGVEVTIGGATVLARRGEHPALTANRLPSGGRVVWLDAERSTAQIHRQRVRDLLKRALVWVNGYALYPEYSRSVLLFMDDMGAADKTFYPGWHYPTLSEEKIRTTLIEPLQRRHGVMVQNVNTGFVDRRTRRVLNPWQQLVVDELDPTITHDFASTKRGLAAGLAAGVFEIQSHGWTHLSPDLDSPPGPFWSAPPKSAVIAQNWYKEFGDIVRKVEVPAIVQRLHLQRGLDGIEQDFGVRAVSLVCGGGYGSRSAANHTMRIAAKLGLGLGQVESVFYLGNDLCFPLEPVSPRLQWAYTERLTGAEIPWTPDAPVWIGFHDRDVAMDGPSFARLLDDLGGGLRYMTFAEYCGYLHARVERARTPTGALALRVGYDEGYGGFFRSHPSTWVLHLADETRAAMKAPSVERRTVRLPEGLGFHDVQP